MDLAKLSERVTRDLCAAVSADLDAKDRAAVADIVQKALLDASSQAHEACKSVAVVCCGPEADLAHKLQEQMDAKREMLIANLMAMR